MFAGIGFAPLWKADCKLFSTRPEPARHTGADRQIRVAEALDLQRAWRVPAGRR